jgi:hypothetical protein
MVQLFRECGSRIRKRGFDRPVFSSFLGSNAPPTKDTSDRAKPTDANASDENNLDDGVDDGNRPRESTGVVEILWRRSLVPD